VLTVRPEGEGVVLAQIDTERIREVRSALPALVNRRLN
jgi:predicted amidohydrolase